MSKYFIEFKGKKYELKEPTIQNYTNVMKLKDIIDESELFINMISELTTLSKEEILTAPAKELKEVGDLVSRYFLQGNKNISPTITHNGQKYNLIDLDNISFGQFVDIDTFLSKEENYRLINLSELASYLYVEEGTEYRNSDFKKRKEALKELPLKHLESAIFFLVSIGHISAQSIQIYSENKLLYKMMMKMVRLGSIGDGIPRLVSYLTMILLRLITLLSIPLLVVSTTLHTLWIYLKHKIKNKNLNNVIYGANN